MPETQPESFTADDGLEVELKFALTMEDTLRLLQNPPWRTELPGTVKQLHSVYFDTADHALREAGFSLRVRSDGAGLIQTVKTMESGGEAFAERGEWSCPVRSMRPNLRAQAAAMLRQALAGGHSTDAETAEPEKSAPLARVAPIFSVDVTRHKFDVRFEGADIEIAVDIGEIIAGSRRESFCELELELKSGPKVALFELAATILAAVPIRLDPQAKAERGFALVKGGFDPRRAEPVALVADLPLRGAFQQIARNCLHHFLANESAFWRGRPPETVHQMRVAIRRLRAAMVVFRRICRDALFDPLISELRWVAGELGRARDLDVYIEGILHDGAAAYGEDPAYQAITADTCESRERAYDQVFAVLASSRFRHLSITLAQWIECGDWLGQSSSGEPDLIAHAARQMSRRWKRVRKFIKRRAKLDDDASHEWRIEVKKLRYMVEFFLPLFIPLDAPRRKETLPYLASKHLSGLQDGLGELHDMAEAKKHGQLSKITGKLLEIQEKKQPKLLLGVDMDAAALTVLIPFWKGRKS